MEDDTKAEAPAATSAPPSAPSEAGTRVAKSAWDSDEEGDDEEDDDDDQPASAAVLLDVEVGDPVRDRRVRELRCRLLDLAADVRQLGAAVELRERD